MPPAREAAIHDAVTMRVNFIDLSPCLQRNAGPHLLSVALDDHDNSITHFFCSQRIREIVKILYRFSVELDEQIALLQASFCRGAVVLNVSEKDAFQIIAKIGNGPEVGTVAATASGNRGLRLLDFSIFQAL